MTSEETLLKEIKELKECLSRLEEYLFMSCQIQQNILKLYDLQQQNILKLYSLLQSDIDDLKPCNNIEQGDFKEIPPRSS